VTDGPTTAALIEIEHLTKRFGHFTAVDDVSFSVARGEVLGFLGPNGAGKSTTMRMLAGFMPPSTGTARICGHDVQTDGIAARRMLGFLPEGAPTYPDMTAQGFLRFVAKVRGFRGQDLDERVAKVVALTHLDQVLDQPIETLSKGFKRRVGLAQALLHDPPVLVLDEPTDGLDPNQKREVRALISEMKPHKAIVISTHILEEVDAVCTRAIIIAAGRVVADETPGALQARHPSGRLEDVFHQLTLDQRPGDQRPGDQRPSDQRPSDQRLEDQASGEHRPGDRPPGEPPAGEPPPGETPAGEPPTGQPPPGKRQREAA
jgi:ABC-2 type transport system ATP-binding protein